MTYNPTAPKNQQVIALVDCDRTTYTMLSICNLQSRKIIEFKSTAEMISSSEKLQLNIVTIISQGDIMGPMGIPFVESLNKKKFQKIPFFLVSSNLDMNICKLALRAGITDIFKTPVTIPKLETRINFMIDNWSDLNITSKGGKKKSYTVPFATRLFDLFVAIIGITILLPFFLLFFILIKISSKGPGIYSSLKVGADYKIFKQYKFRTTTIDKPGSTVDYESPEARLTGIGKFLKSSKIDELPQLFNVIKGNMSIVGNAPLPLYEAEKLTTDKYILRFMAPAGITGSWQVEKRFNKGIISEESRWILDSNYAQNQSFMIDMQLFLRTFPALFKKGSIHKVEQQ
jgi:lipopolysaccharide/colanic/teichoic acid biosynthesis glycosyltransferase